MTEEKAKAILMQNAQDIKEHKAVSVTTLPQCDMCVEDNKAIFDCKTKTGQWGHLCGMHYTAYGVGLGLGKGQKLIIN